MASKSSNIAKKVKNSIQISDAECGTNNGVPTQWTDLPIGVKFDPSDTQILEHLAAKCGGDLKAHPLIDKFIPTLENDQGICYTHPGNLPGAKKDGSSFHFFHRTIKAFATGQRKHRKIVKQHSTTTEEHVRWHKTRKTKPVMENGVHQKGWKKVMVLYKHSKRGCKPEKLNWVMHQYHLGPDEQEHVGDYVVSKISYRHTKPTKKRHDSCTRIKEPDNSIIHSNLSTPETVTSNLHYELKESKCFAEGYHLPIHAVGCDPVSFDLHDPGAMEMPTGDDACTCKIPELENSESDTPLDVPLSDLQFGSLESILPWFD